MKVTKTDLVLQRTPHMSADNKNGLIDSSKLKTLSCPSLRKIDLESGELNHFGLSWANRDTLNHFRSNEQNHFNQVKKKRNNALLTDTVVWKLFLDIPFIAFYSGQKLKNKIYFLNITPLFAMGYISEVKLQVTIQWNLPHYNWINSNRHRIGTL